MQALTGLITTGIDTITSDINRKWEHYIEYIKNTSEYEDVLLDTAHAHANTFDLSAIFTKMKIQERYHYPMMRLNGYKTPTDFDGSNKKLRIYPANFMDGIYVKITSK